MKRVDIFFLMVSLFLFVGGCSWRELGLFYGNHVLEKQETLRPVDEDISLIITDEKKADEYGIIEFKGLDQTELLLHQLTEQNKPLVILVHGKGKLEVKGFDPKVIWRVESTYGVKVLTFHWPSYDPIGYKVWPQLNAKATAPYLIQFFEKLEKIKIKEKAQHPVTLVFNSMGARVLMHTLEGKNDSTPCAEKPLYFSQMVDRVLLSGAEAPSNDHEDWLQCIDAETWVTINQGDMMLAAVESLRSSPRLGNDIKVFQKNSIGKQFHFLDLSPVEGGNHDYALGESTLPTIEYFKDFYRGLPQNGLESMENGNFSLLSK